MARFLLLAAPLFAAAPVQAATLGPDLYPGAPRGTLEVRMDIGGGGRWSDANGVEYTNFLASRTVDMRLLMVLSDERRGPMVAIRGHDLTNPEMPEAQQTIANAIEACKGDLGCQIEAATRYGKALEADPDGFGTTEWDDQRYENWISDRSRPCVTGNLAVTDSGDGKAINPPEPAKPFTYERSGTLDLASAPDQVIDRVCDAWLSYDSQEAMVSIRLPAYGLWVETEYSGGYSGRERLQLIEEGPELVFSLDRSTEWNNASLGGIFTVPDIGIASVNGGQVEAPLSATISWRFSPELQ